MSAASSRSCPLGKARDDAPYTVVFGIGQPGVGVRVRHVWAGDPEHAAHVARMTLPPEDLGAEDPVLEVFDGHLVPRL